MDLTSVRDAAIRSFREAMAQYRLPRRLEDRLTVEVGLVGDEGIAALTVPGADPIESVTLVTAKINRLTGEATVEVDVAQIRLLGGVVQ